MKIYILLIALLSSSCVQSSEAVIEENSPALTKHTLSENIGIETLGGVFTPLLNIGCELPCEISQIFSTAEDNQDQITVALVRGKGKFVKDGISLGKYKLAGIKPAPRGVPQVEFTLRASKNNIFLSAKELSPVSELQIVKVN